MNEEEKKARAFLRFYVSDIKDEYFDRDYHIDKKFAETILKLIEKQQKEIEKLKSRKYIFNAETNEIKEIPISDDYISKDKIKGIKAKWDKNISWANADDHYYAMKMLDELLGE